MEKIFKSLEILKASASVQVSSTNQQDLKTKKNERKSHCKSVTDCICNQNNQKLKEFPKILETLLDLLFQFCNDVDADIRLVASDCLNKIARTFRDTSLNRFQMEVYREIKKGQSVRSLQKAIALFAFLSPQIKPQKCRAFMVSLLPCLVQISKRKEELLNESLARSLPEIFKYLGCYMNDNEIKMLCGEFKNNLDSNSIIIRRAASTILVSICQYSKKPQIFLPKLLATSIDFLMPNLMEKSISLTTGVLTTLKLLLQPIYNILRQKFIVDSGEKDDIVKNVIRVYEICLFLCLHDDNIIISCLETLQQLLCNPHESVFQVLTSNLGIQNSFLELEVENKSHHSESYIRHSLGSSSEDTNLLIERELDVRTCFASTNDSGQNVNQDEIENMSSYSSRSNSEVFLTDVLENLDFIDEENKLGPYVSDDSSVNFSNILHLYSNILIGSIYDNDVPLLYCARLLASNFLLTGVKGSLRPDSETRISVKVLALNCFIEIINLRPEIYHLPLPCKGGISAESQIISDIILYSNHSDPLVRGTTLIFIGKLLKSELDHEVERTSQLTSDFDNLTQILQKGLKDSANVGLKCALNGISHCLNIIWSLPDERSKLGSKLHQSVRQVASNDYWLIKVNLVELLAKIQWDIINDPNRKIIEAQAFNTVLNFITDEDFRVRNSSITALVSLIKNYGKQTSFKKMPLLCFKCQSQEIVVVRSSTTEKCHCTCNSSFSSKKLEKIIKQIAMFIVKGVSDKCTFGGFYKTLCSLSVHFPPKDYRSAWGCSSSSEVPLLLVLAIESLQSYPFIHYDTSIHGDLLIFARNILAGSIIKKPLENETGKTNINSNYYKISTQLFQHCLTIIKIYQSIIEPTSSTKGNFSNLGFSPGNKKGAMLDSTDKKLEDRIEEKKGADNNKSNINFTIYNRKIFKIIQQQWKIYKVNLETTVEKKFTSLLLIAIETIGVLCSFFTSDNLGLSTMMEEIVNKMYSVFYLCPIQVLKCVKQIIICIFSSYQNKNNSNLKQDEQTKGLTPIERFDVFRKNNLRIILCDKRETVSGKHTDISLLGNYIRQFESIVIAGLRIYTTCSDSDVQTEVLSLLNQLIEFHINYSLIDANQVFLGFVINQIGILEEGQARNTSRLVEEIFYFLNMLSHEQHLSKKFIDKPKILRLCDSLIVSGQDPLFFGIPALRPLVTELFLQSGTSALSEFEHSEVETRREVVLQMLLRLPPVPEVLHILWVLVEGRRISCDPKWSIDSSTISNFIIPLIINGEMRIVTKIQFSNLMALLYSINPAAFHFSELIAYISTLSENFVIKGFESFRVFLVILNSHWLLAIKVISSLGLDWKILKNQITTKLVLDTILKLLMNFNSLMQSFELISNEYSDFIIDQIHVFFEGGILLLKTGDIEENLKPDYINEVFKNMSIEIAKFKKISPRFHTCPSEFLSIILHFHENNLWKRIFSKNVCAQKFAKTLLIVTLGEINKKKGFEGAEEWIVNNFIYDLLHQIIHPEISMFFDRLNKSALKEVFRQLEILMDSWNSEIDKYDLIIAKNILIFLERIHQNDTSKAAMILLKLLLITNNSSVRFDISQSCYLYFCQGKDSQIIWSREELKIMRSFVGLHLMKSRYPRLNLVISQILDLSDDSPLMSKPIIILTWCSEQIVYHNEGVAIAKMLNELTYTQIVEIMNQKNFNFSILQYSFLYLENSFYLELINGEEIMDLLSSENKSLLVEKWPLGVATIDFLNEKLQTWEKIPNNHFDDLLESKNCQETLCDLPFIDNLELLWKAITGLHSLKSSVIENGDINTKLTNQYFPTKLFTFSFLYMKMMCEKKDLSVKFIKEFLKFCSAAMSDETFAPFFTEKNKLAEFTASVFSLAEIFKKTLKVLKIEYNPDHSVATKLGFHNDPNEILKVAVIEIYQILFMDLKKLELTFENNILNLFRKILVGFGRSEVLNMNVLISHFVWKSNVDDDVPIITRMDQIPVEILRNDKSTLVQYIAKLNLIGVSNKLQFEENWMNLLAVINSYGDEAVQLKLIATGLNGLSTLLKRVLRVNYVLIEKNRLSKCTRKIKNEYEIDFNSCIQFLIDLFSQWLKNYKIPMMLLTEIIHNIIVMSNYFEEISQYFWMYETLSEIFHGSIDEKNDEAFSSLIFGLFIAAAKIDLDSENLSSLEKVLDDAIASSHLNIRIAAIKSGLLYLQYKPECVKFLNILSTYSLKKIHLSQTLNDSEKHSIQVWSLVLFVWNHSTEEVLKRDHFEDEILENVLTIMSPLNNVYVSVRILVLKALQIKYSQCEVRPEIKKMISKVTLESMQTKSLGIFFEAVKLFLSIFYIDFQNFCHNKQSDPEGLSSMAERIDILFRLLKKESRGNQRIVSKVLSILISDFFPPSDILNRLMAEFLSPQQINPELLAPCITEVLKSLWVACRESSGDSSEKQMDVGVWVLSALPSLLNGPQTARSTWTLTYILAAASANPLVHLAQLRPTNNPDPHILSAAITHFHASLGTCELQLEFLELLRQGPFQFQNLASELEPRL